MTRALAALAVCAIVVGALSSLTLSACMLPTAVAEETAPPARDGGVAAPQRARNVPPHYFEQQYISNETPHLPDAAKPAAGGELQWLGKVCAATDGHISQVSIVSGIRGADESIMATMRGWRLRPQPFPICTLVRFVFSVPPKPRK